MYIYITIKGKVCIYIQRFSVVRSSLLPCGVLRKVYFLTIYCIARDNIHEKTLWQDVLTIFAYYCVCCVLTGVLREANKQIVKEINRKVQGGVCVVSQLVRDK